MFESDTVKEKLSFSIAIAQSCYLSYYESEVEKTIQETKTLPIEMRDSGIISLSKKQICKKIGTIFMRKTAVNLSADILSSSDLFSESEDLGSVYDNTRKLMDINKRIELLNKRMNILTELYDILNDEVKIQSYFSLEWIVIYLIVIEVSIMLFWEIIAKDLLGFCKN